MQQINRSLQGVPESIQAKTLNNIIEAFRSKKNLTLDALYDNLISILRKYLNKILKKFKIYQ